MKIACAPLPDRAARTQQGTTHAAHLRLSVRAILFMNLIEMFWLTKEYVFLVLETCDLHSYARRPGLTISDCVLFANGDQNCNELNSMVGDSFHEVGQMHQTLTLMLQPSKC